MRHRGALLCANAAGYHAGQTACVPVCARMHPGAYRLAKGGWPWKLRGKQLRTGPHRSGTADPRDWTYRNLFVVPGAPSTLTLKFSISQSDVLERASSFTRLLDLKAHSFLVPYTRRIPSNASCWRVTRHIVGRERGIHHGVQWRTRRLSRLGQPRSAAQRSDSSQVFM